MVTTKQLIEHCDQAIYAVNKHCDQNQLTHGRGDGASAGPKPSGGGRSATN